MAHERERAAFNELKKRMKGDMEIELYNDDNVFYRFLRARDMKVDVAEGMLRDHLEWRKKYDIKNISKFKSPEALKLYVECNFLGFTKEGYILRYSPSGNFDIRGAFASCSAEEMLKHLIKFYEDDHLKLKEQSKKMGKLVDKVVYIYDTKNLTFEKVTDKKVILFVIELSIMYQNNFPETLSMLLFINAPIFFSLVYNMVKPILPTQIVRKIKVFSESDDGWKNLLMEIADAEIVPAFLGGKKTDPDGNPLCNTFINHAGLIPEKYYIKNKQNFIRLPDVQKLVISRTAVHEMYLEVKEPDSHLEWELLLKSGDIKFGITYQNDNGNKTEVVPSQYINADEYSRSGFYRCTDVGTYIMQFDNSYSFLRSKEIYYKVQIMSLKNDD